MSDRGGKREGAGRKRNAADVDDIKVGKGFATRVLARVKELNLKTKRGKEIKSAEDYALDMLEAGDAEAKSFFKLLLAYQLGKPVQPTITADTREFASPLERGSQRSYFETPAHSAGSDKPN